MRFQHQVVAITGAAQGIGRQTAEQAAREGARLLLIDRSRYVHELAATLVEGGSDVLALEADLEQWESTEQAFAAGVAHFGRLDVVINNIGGTIWARPSSGGACRSIARRWIGCSARPVIRRPASSGSWAGAPAWIWPMACRRRSMGPELLLVPANEKLPADEKQHVRDGDVVPVREERHP